MALIKGERLYLPESGKAFRSIIESNARINLWDGAVRSGKTWASIVRWLEYVARVPEHINLMMIGKTERTLYRNIITEMQKMLGPDAVVFNQGRSELKVYGRTIFTASANDESSQDKIRGITLGGAYGDEITLWPESFYNMLLSRLSVRGSKLFATTNPDGPYHYIKRELIDRAEELNPPGQRMPGFKRFHFTLDDNPTLDPAYVASLKREYSGVWYQRLIEGLWVQAEGAVYPMWDTRRHIVKVDKTFRYYIIGIDYGTHNPCSFVLIGYDSYGGPFTVCEEYYYDGRTQAKSGAAQKTDSQYADDLQKFIGKRKLQGIFADPSALSFRTECQRRGLYLAPADNSILDGIRYVGTLLSNNMLYVDRSCRNVQKEFSSYAWDEKAQMRGEDKPLPENDHALDAIRYALYTMFGRMRGGVIGGFSM